MLAVKEAILVACEKRRWPLKTLANHIGKSEDTLAAWRDGKVAKFEIDALREIFVLSEMSMDTAFGLNAAPGEVTELRKLKDTYLAVIRVITGQDPSALIAAITEQQEIGNGDSLPDRGTMTRSRKELHDGIGSVKHGLEDIEDEDESGEKTG